jgi:hypothetical protein
MVFPVFEALCASMVLRLADQPASYSDHITNGVVHKTAMIVLYWR